MSNNMRIIDYKEKYLKYKKKYTNSKIKYVGGANGTSSAKALLSEYLTELKDEPMKNIEELETKIKSSEFVYLKKKTDKHIVIFICNKEHTDTDFGKQVNKEVILQMIKGKKVVASHKGPLNDNPKITAHGIVLSPA